MDEKFIWVCKKHGMLEVSETGIATKTCPDCKKYRVECAYCGLVKESDEWISIPICDCFKKDTQ